MVNHMWKESKRATKFRIIYMNTTHTRLFTTTFSKSIFTFINNLLNCSNLNTGTHKDMYT